MARAAHASEASPRTVTEGEVINSSAVRAEAPRDPAEAPTGGGPSPRRSSLRSRPASETTPTTRVPSATTGTALTCRCSRARTISLNDARRVTATTLHVITSPTVIGCRTAFMAASWARDVPPGSSPGRCGGARTVRPSPSHRASVSGTVSRTTRWPSSADST